MGFSLGDRESVDPGVSIPAYGLFGEDVDSIAYHFIHVESLSVRNVNNAWHIPRHYHPNLDQISIVLSGDCRFELGGEDYEALGSSVVYMPAHSIHDFNYEIGASGFIVTFSREFLNHFTREHAELADSRRHLILCKGRALSGDTRQIKAVCDMLADNTYNLSPASMRETKFLFFHLWILLCKATQGAGPNGPIIASDVPLFDRFRQLLEASFQVDAGGASKSVRRTAEHFAAQLGVSVFRLNKATRSAVNASANELIKEAMLGEAARLLLYSTLPVTEIANLLGYSHSSHFIRFFKQERGISPQNFRMNNTVLKMREK